MSEKIKFVHAVGVEVEDTVTGFIGVVTGQFHYLNGCHRYLLEGRGKEPGSKGEELVYDEDRLTPTGGKDRKIEQTPTGGPQATPARERHG